MKTRILNMTEGNPTKLLLQFSIPMLIGNLFQQLYNLVDSIVVGKLIGPDALAAIGATSSITFFFFAICNGFGSGGGIITSQLFGAGENDRIKRCIVNCGYIMIVVPLIIGLISIAVAAPLLNLLETPAEIFDDALFYMKIMCGGVIFVSLYNYASSMLRALGDSQTPLYFLIFSCILNTILDYIFVKYLLLGVAGAGYATLISQFISGGLCIAFALRKNPYFSFSRKHMSLDRKIITDVVKLGFPLSMQFSLIAISSMALQRVVNLFGPVAVAAFTATGRIEQLVHQLYITLSTSLSTYSGQNYGAARNDRVIEGYKKGLLIMFLTTLFLLPLMFILGDNIMAIFVNDADVIQMGAIALKITSLFYILLGMIYVVRGVLSGIGDSSFALQNGIIEVICRFIIPAGLTSIPAIGLWGIWWSVGVAWGISGITAWLRYIYDKKKLLS